MRTRQAKIPEAVQKLGRNLSMAHVCHARGCTTAVRPELLMCGRHWRMVPKAVQQAVWRAYRPGQCEDRHVSLGWLEAANAAIGAVATREGHSLTVQERMALRRFALVLAQGSA